MVTRARIELALQPWKGRVLTAWPTGHYGSGDWIRTGDTSGMNRMLWPTELRRHIFAFRTGTIYYTRKSFLCQALFCDFFVFFIPLFEKNNFIKKLDFYVYEEVFKFLQRCIDKNDPIVPISMNMSRNHNKPDKFIHDFLAIFRKYNIPPKYIQIELLERGKGE